MKINWHPHRKGIQARVGRCFLYVGDEGPIGSKWMIKARCSALESGNAESINAAIYAIEGGLERVMFFHPELGRR